MSELLVGYLMFHQVGSFILDGVGLLDQANSIFISLASSLFTFVWCSIAVQ